MCSSCKDSGTCFCCGRVISRTTDPKAVARIDQAGSSRGVPKFVRSADAMDTELAQRGHKAFVRSGSGEAEASDYSISSHVQMGRKLKDGRLQCKQCCKRVVETDSEAQDVWRSVVATLSKAGLVLPAHDAALVVHVADMATLQRETGVHHYTPKGGAPTRCTTGVTRSAAVKVNGVEVSRRVNDILVLHGISYEHAAAVLAHEFMHAWAHINCFPRMPPQVEEGMAELCSAVFISFSPQTLLSQYRLAELWLNRDQVYGEGFRKAEKSLRQLNGSLSELILFVYRNKSFPI